MPDPVEIVDARLRSVDSGYREYSDPGPACHAEAGVGTEQVLPITRRLAAVVFAHVAGWSRLIEQNDIETLRAWKALRADLIEPRIREHGGRLLEVAGDAVLIEFASAVAAVTWALDTQRALSQGESEGRGAPLRMRIGINVEDVIVDEDKLIGDGVNIAARIHQFASPGDIVVTGAVRDYVWNKMPVADREPPPGTQAAFGALIKAWADSGGACPPRQAREMTVRRVASEGWVNRAASAHSRENPWSSRPR